MLVCETPRLLIRRLDATDAPFILRLLNEPSFLENIGDRGVRSVDDALTYLMKGPFASYDQHGFGLFHVSLKDGGEAIGMCGLLKRDTLPDVDIGYAFRPAFWSKGYAYEATSAVLAHGWEAFGLKRIVAITAPDNAGSKAVLAKLGLRFEESISLFPGQDTDLFAIESQGTP